jgi:hypothetical protein
MGLRAALKAHLDEMRVEYGNKVVVIAMEVLVPAMQDLGKRITQ